MLNLNQSLMSFKNLVATDLKKSDARPQESYAATLESLQQRVKDEYVTKKQMTLPENTVPNGYFNNSLTQRYPYVGTQSTPKKTLDTSSVLQVPSIGNAKKHRRPRTQTDLPSWKNKRTLLSSYFEDLNSSAGKLRQDGGGLSDEFLALQLGSPTKRWSKRKQSNPRKSPELFDPSFRGVTITLNTKIEHDRVKLEIRHTYSYSLEKKWKRRMKLMRSPSNDDSQPELHSDSRTSPLSDSDDHTFIGSDPESRVAEKECASCGTTKTPLWRDADTIPLCNACGIRYRKYHIRCISCWYVPKKTGKIPSKCRYCGSSVRASHPRKI